MARRRVSQTTLGAHMGLKQASVSARLTGRTPFDINELHAVADFLDVPLAVLLKDGVEAAAS
jgi:transcriptional regulator with XRE-family HTH domain